MMAPNLSSFEEIISLVPAGKRFLIAIDGRPCSDKSTLADRIVDATHGQALFLDDFFISKKDWPNTIEAIFHFPYFRNDDITRDLHLLSQGCAVSYRPYDWSHNGP